MHFSESRWSRRHCTFQIVCEAYRDYKYIMFLELRSLLYTCCRDGKPRENKCPRKTDEKRKIMKKSRKLEGSYCLARMHVKHHISSGNVVVTYISTHTNHSLGLEECKYIPLPQSVRKEIQQKFAQGITLERIMDGNTYNHSPCTH